MDISVTENRMPLLEKRLVSSRRRARKQLTMEGHRKYVPPHINHPAQVFVHLVLVRVITSASSNGKHTADIGISPDVLEFVIFNEFHGFGHGDRICRLS